MPTQPFPRALLAGCLVLIPVVAAAAAKPFTGPAGWDHSVVATPTPALPRAQETWKKSDSEVLTYLSDAALSYDDIVAMVKKNLSDNGMRPSYDKDRTCDGKRAHEVELTFGTTVVRQIIIDDAPGVTKLTYTRTQGSPQSPDELAAISAYCGP